MYQFVSIPAIMFIIMVGFIIFLIAFNFYLFYKWGKSLEEENRLKDIIDENEKVFLDEFGPYQENI